MRNRCLLAMLCLLTALPASAQRQPFGASLSASLLEEHQAEVALSTRPRAGREDYFVGFDHLAELRLGFSPRAQFELGLEVRTATVGTNRTEALQAGARGGLLYGLLDRRAAPVGLALRAGVVVGAEEVAGQARLAIDRELGGLLLGANLSATRRWALTSETRSPFELEQSAGVGYRVTEAFSANLEGRHHMLYEKGHFQGSALYLGPSFSWARGRWWASLTLFSQVAALKPGTSKEPLELVNHERFEGLLAFGLKI